MTDQFTGRAVDVDSSEIVKLLAGGVENFRADHYADEDALTVEIFRPFMTGLLDPSAPRTLHSLAGNS